VSSGECDCGFTARRFMMRTSARPSEKQRQTYEARRQRILWKARVTPTRIPPSFTPRFTLPTNTLNTRTALTLYLLIVSVITARTVALTLIKVQLNKTKTENNHFCLTGKMARYVAEAVTTHAPLTKHMFFRPELCAGLYIALTVLHRAIISRSFK